MSHEISYFQPEKKLGNSPIVLNVKLKNKALGQLQIWKGKIIWVSKNLDVGRELTWTKFDNFMKRSNYTKVGGKRVS